MPWSLTHFPASMKNLPPNVRAQAIRISNALLKEEMNEGTAIRIGIYKAKKDAHISAARQRGALLKPNAFRESFP